MVMKASTIFHQVYCGNFSFRYTFLDTTATLVNGEIGFNLYTKPTNSHFSSAEFRGTLKCCL
jgi:hypothetical protein